MPSASRVGFAFCELPPFWVPRRLFRGLIGQRCFGYAQGVMGGLLTVQQFLDRFPQVDIVNESSFHNAWVAGMSNRSSPVHQRLNMALGNAGS